MSNIHIYHNTIINSENLRLGGDGNSPPSNVTIANNVFTDPRDQLFNQATGNEIWINNLSSGDIGINEPSTGLTETDPQLAENTEGFFQPEIDSPVVGNSADGYPMVPLYEGMDYDNEILFDLMKEPRPIATPAIGASEFSSTVNVQPHATEMNTGPTYLFDNLVDYLAANVSLLFVGNTEENRSIKVTSNIEWTVMSSMDWISTDLPSGSGDAELVITIDANPENERRSGTLTFSGGPEPVTIIVNQDAGETVSVLENIESKVLLFPNPTNGGIKLSNLPSGNSNSQVELIHPDGRSVFSKAYPIKGNELSIDLNDLSPGTYILNIKLMSPNGIVNAELTRQFVRN